MIAHEIADMRARTRRASALAAAVACVGLACVRDARADETPSVAAATVLFDEAVALLDWMSAWMSWGSSDAS